MKVLDRHVHVRVGGQRLVLPAGTSMEDAARQIQAKADEIGVDIDDVVEPTNPKLWRDARGEGVNVEPEEDFGDDEDDALSRMTVNQLRKYADENGVDLGGATKKADILDIISNTVGDAEL